MFESRIPEIEISENNGVAWIFFNRPHAKNAVTFEMYSEIKRLCEEVNKRNDISCLVFKGQGGEAFVAGTDISHFSKFEDESDGVDYERKVEEVIRSIENIKIPTIAVLEGHCIGGGAVIALACDFRFATDDLNFRIPITKTLGNCISTSNLQRIVNIVGLARAKEIVLLAKPMKSKEAKNCGLVTMVCDRSSIMKEVEEMAYNFSEFAPLSIYAAKQGFNRVAEGMHENIYDEDLVKLCYNSRDFQGAVNSFINKERYNWIGE